MTFKNGEKSLYS